MGTVDIPNIPVNPGDNFQAGRLGDCYLVFQQQGVDFRSRGGPFGFHSDMIIFDLKTRFPMMGRGIKIETLLMFPWLMGQKADDLMIHSDKGEKRVRRIDWFPPFSWDLII